MILELLLPILLASSPVPVSQTADLDGDGSPETIIATSRARAIRVDVQNSAGKRIARAQAPSPEPNAAAVTLAVGSLSGSGALLEVSAVGATRQCLSIWRLRGRELSRVALVSAGGRVADCSTAEGWTDRWVKAREDAPADYVRERTRESPQGVHRQTEIYRFTGFDLTLDRARSTSEIGGVSIPDWAPALLYPKALVDALVSCFDLSAYKKAPRLRILADREQGVLAISIERPAFPEQRIPITASKQDGDPRRWILTAGTGASAEHLRVELAADRRTPLQVALDTSDQSLNQLFVPVTRITSQGLELFASAEEELALYSLSGSWDDSHGKRIQARTVSGQPTTLDFDGQKVALNISAAPTGADVLLLPRDGSSPRTALRLRGPDAFSRVTVECSPGSAPDPDHCKVVGSGETFHRLGSSMNAH